MISHQERGSGEADDLAVLYDAVAPEQSSSSQGIPANPQKEAAAMDHRSLALVGTVFIPGSCAGSSLGSKQRGVASKEAL